MKPTQHTPCHRPIKVGDLDYTAEQINQLLSLIPYKADRKEISALISFTGQNYIGHYPSATLLKPQDRFAWALVGSLSAAAPYFHYTAGNEPEGYTAGWNNMQPVFGTYDLAQEDKEDEITSEDFMRIPLHLPLLTADRAIADEHGNRIADTYETRQAVRNHIREVYNEQFIENPPLVTDGYITPQMLSESTKELLENTGQSITNVPDGEDLTTKNGVLKLSDKPYNPGAYSGMGRIYLRKNLVGGQNLLTQAMVSKPNTIYILQYDYTLNGAEITIPEGCVLDFQGGRLSNGVLNCQYCAIYGTSKLFDNTKLINVISLQAEWLGLHPNNQDNSNIFNNIFKYLDKNNGITIIFDTGTYNFYKPVEIPIEYLGLRIISKTEKASYNGTVFYYKGNKTDTFVTARAQNVYFKGIKFVGPGYTHSETSVILDFKRTDVATYNEDGWNDTEPNVEHCTFQNAAKCIRVTGRQTIIQECVFSLFSTGIEFYNILDSNGNEWTYGERGGSSRCNRIYKNQFHAINHQGKDGKNNACIVNNCKQSRWFVIQDNLNDGAGSFFSGYIDSSVITGNVTYIFDGYPFYIKKCSNSVIENNHFIYNNEYDEGGQLLLASAGSMYFDGACYSSRIIGNTIYRTALSAIRLKDSSVNFTNNEIKNNKFYRIGNALPEEDRYVIDLGTYGYIDGNVITDNFWDQGAGEEYLPSKFIRIRSNAGTGNNIVRNNYSSYMTRRAFGKTDKRSKDLGSSYDGETGIQYYDIDLSIPLFWTGDEFLDSEGIFPYRRMGDTLPIPPRQAGAWIGAPFFDTINKKPLWLNGWEDNGAPKWLDSEGNRADCKKSGLFNEKPVGPTIGYSYFCTDRQTAESGISGIVIFYKGDNVWVDALGRVVG